MLDIEMLCRCSENNRVEIITGLHSAGFIWDSLRGTIPKCVIKSVCMPVCTKWDDFLSVPYKPYFMQRLADLSCADVPDDDIVVGSGGEEDVLGGGVPQDEAHAPLVLHQVHHGVCHCPAG